MKVSGTADGRTIFVTRPSILRSYNISSKGSPAYNSVVNQLAKNGITVLRQADVGSGIATLGFVLETTGDAYGALAGS